MKYIIAFVVLILLLVATLPMRGTGLDGINAFVHQSGNFQYTLLGVYVAGIVLSVLLNSKNRSIFCGRYLLVLVSALSVLAFITKSLHAYSIAEDLLLNPPAELPSGRPDLLTSFWYLRQAMNHLLLGTISAITVLGINIRNRTIGSSVPSTRCRVR